MRRQNLSRIAFIPGAMAMVAATMVSAGCNLHSLKAVELEKAQEDERELTLQVNKDVDILFVIDNSGSMGDEQGLLAQNFPAFIDVLEAEDVDANYRIGITTTDNGNTECNNTSPEGGKLRLLSCTDRADEFTWPKVNPQVMAYDVACGSVCPDAVANAINVVPTATANDAMEKTRPWIQRIEGVSNIEGVTTAEAFQCFGPQGVDGCGFEAQLESMFKAVQRASVTSEAQYDFIRETAILAVVQVTDEADCSANEAQQAQVFDRNLPEAQKVFWEDPSSSVPTSAICWNAGVKCTGGSGGTYDDCSSQDYAVDGTEDPSNPNDNAVLRPVSRYIDLLQGIEDQKQQFNPDQEVIVALLGGVPNGYSSGNADLVYQDSSDQADQIANGIGFGCSSSINGVAQEAVPPVRLREFAEAFNTAEDPNTERNIFSICSNDYSPALEAVANAIRDQVRPGCYEKCVKDTDESTPMVLDADCTVTEEEGTTGQKREVPECENGMLPDGADVCYVTKTGDTMAQECVDDGWNLEFEIVRDPTKPPSGGTSVSATCQLSDFPELDCPNL